MGKQSRDKGKRYEQFLARLFREYGYDAKRHLEFQGEEAEEGRDLDGTYPFAIQAKCWKSAPPITVLETVTTTEAYPIRLAILKRSSVSKKPLEVVVMDLSTFMEMILAIEEGIMNGELPEGTWSKIIEESM